MASLTGTIAEVGGAYNGVMSVLNGPPVKIGGIGLTSLEVPATMSFGGSQKLVVHDLVGGGRKVDALGAYEDDITWSGYFSGPSAVSRARAMDALRKAGKQVDLTWADFKRQCVIKSFVAEYGRGGALLPYKISMVVLPPVQSAAKPGLLQSIKSSISNALNLPAITAAVQPALTAVQAVMPIAAVLVPGSSAFGALSGAVGTASSVLAGAQSLADSQLSSISAAASAAGQIFGSGGLQAAAAAQDALTSTTQAAGYVGQANGMLGRA